MRHAFTMIELIFVIVIIGILAAVAIPKLSATRDDAYLTRLKANTRICINDLASLYRGQGVSVDIDTVQSCLSAKENGASITYNNDVIRISNVDTKLNGDYVYKGTSVVY